MDGMEYLALCRQEASLIPDLMVYSGTVETLAEGSIADSGKTDSIRTEIIDNNLGTSIETTGDSNNNSITLKVEQSSKRKPPNEWIQSTRKNFKQLSSLRLDKNPAVTKLSCKQLEEFIKSAKPKLMPVHQSKLLRLLQSFIEKELNLNDLIWIYGLLARLDTLLEADDVAMLRELMKWVISSRLGTNGDYYIGCTMIIVIIGWEFGQKDLLD